MNLQSAFYDEALSEIEIPSDSNLAGMSDRQPHRDVKWSAVNDDSVDDVDED